MGSLPRRWAPADNYGTTGLDYGRPDSDYGRPD